MPLAEKLQGAVPNAATIGQVLRTMAEIRDGQRPFDLQNAEQALIANFA